MTIEIELFDGTVLEFPDGTDPTVIDRVAKTETATRQPQAAAPMISPPALGNPPPSDAHPFTRIGPQLPSPPTTGPRPRNTPELAGGSATEPRPAGVASRVTFDEWAGMPRADRAAAGLPVSPLGGQIDFGRGFWTPDYDAYVYDDGTETQFKARAMEWPAADALGRAGSAVLDAAMIPAGAPGYPVSMGGHQIGEPTAQEVLGRGAQAVRDWQANGRPRDPENSWGDWLLDVMGSGARGLRRGVAATAGLPVELINASPLLGNILPGTQGFTPFSERPAGGAADFDEALRFGVPRLTQPLVQDYQPQTASGRFANRIGEEVGATGAMMAGPGAAAARLGVEGARDLNPVARSFVEPLAVNAPKVAGRETGYAVASGAGAQAANEMIDPAQHEGTWWSEMLGSLAGMGALGTVNSLAGAARNAIGAATGRTGAFDDVAGRAVADRLIDNSSIMQGQYAAGGKESVDATGLATALSNPSAAEAAIPGFRANVADRVVDPGLSTLAYNADTAMPGAANARRTANAAAVDQVMTDIAPEGNATLLREALGAGAQGRIDTANDAARAARLSFGNAEADITPMTSPTERGAALRAALADRYSTEQDRIAGLYGQIDNGVPADMAGLRDRMRGVTEGLPMNDADRFVPSEARTAERLVPEDAEEAIAPISEAMSIRSGLSSDIRSTDNPQQRRVTGQYLDEVNAFINQALPEEQRLLFDQARTERLGIGRRFEDRGAVPDILRSTGRDQYVMPDEAVPGRALRGETDYRATMAEAGQDPAARKAVADQVLADAQRANALRTPEALARFMQDRNFALSDMPEVRQALETAGVSRQQLNAAEAAAKQTEKAYSPGGASAAGQYLRYDDTRTRDAIGTAWKSAQPDRAVREILDVAGDTPDTRAAAKAALWQEVSGTGKLDATTMTSADGVQRWSGRKLKKLFDDPKFAKTADVLWEDNPEHLQNMRGVVDALATADGSVNAKAPASSGSAQSLTGKFDPALSTSSIASRVRSVHRGQLSPTIAVVDVLSTALRNRSARVQERAISELMTRAINDPKLAADLLRRYNPADEAAENRAFLTRFGTRLPTVANIMAGSDTDDEETFDRSMSQ